MPSRSDAVAGALNRGFDSMLRRGLRGVWLRGEVMPGPFVWAANHHSWWDPFVAAVLLERLGHVPCLIMRQENLERYAFARHLGVFGTAEHRRGLAYLRQGRVLVIYPEGELRPPGPLGDIAGGAAWFADQARVPLCAVATRVLLRGHEAPEAYVLSAQVDATGAAQEMTCRLADALASQLSDLDRLVATSDPRQPLPGYRRVVRGRRSWDERIDGAARWWPWRR